ncbi:MAG: anti-sigma factor [Mesorhizobium sp.]
MSLAEHGGPDDGGEDLLAAEYVVGVLPAEERERVARRIESDPAFARLVDLWEVRLAPLAEAYDPAEVPAAVKAALDRRLFAGAPAAAEGAGLWSSLAFWRGLSAASLAALAVAIALPLLRPAPPTPERLVASLAADQSDVRYLAFVDPAHDRISLSHLSGERAAGRDFELWMIEGKNPPVSMGVVPVGSTIRIVVTPELRAKLAQGAVLAISLEPSGGSPTGQPTGPVVAAGDLKDI